MPIKYILDTREEELQKLYTNNNIPFESIQLDLGDILILYSKKNFSDIDSKQNKISPNACKLLKSSNESSSSSSSPPESIEEEKVHTIVIERKSYTDLKASMSDGRYHEQKSRYMKLPRGTCYYILENNDPSFSKLGKKQFIGAYIHTIVRDGISVFLTNSLIQTFECLQKIGETLESFGVSNPENSYSPEVSQIKKKKANPEEIYIQQLSCIPGISSGKAKLIAQEYPSIISFMESLKNNTFKAKGIGKVLSEKIRESVLGKDDQKKEIKKETKKETKKDSKPKIMFED